MFNVIELNYEKSCFCLGTYENVPSEIKILLKTAEDKVSINRARELSVLLVGQQCHNTTFQYRECCPALWTQLCVETRTQVIWKGRDIAGWVEKEGSKRSS